MARIKKGVYFVAGHIGRRNVIGLSAFLNQYEDDDEVEFTRCYSYNHDTNTWLHTNWQHEFVSISYTRVGTDWTWHRLSKRGLLVQVSQSGKRELQIPDAGTGPGKLGYVAQVRLIADQLYVCGFRRQVYRLDGTNWTHIDQGILAPADERSFSLESIDGTAADDIYAAGFKGELFHYNGHSWTKIDLPTNLDLNWVKCVSTDLVYACGDGGILVRGSGHTWDIIHDPDLTKNFYCVDVLDGVVYLANMGELRFLDGDKFPLVDTGLDPAPKSYRLHARDGLLWSFGQEDLVFFDGKKWERVVCPDNAVP